MKNESHPPLFLDLNVQNSPSEGQEEPTDRVGPASPQPGPAPAVQASCNICGNNSFGRGPGGRLSSSGLPPRCDSCGSLERHRVVRSCFAQLREALDLSEMRALQFSKDPSVDPTWFAEREMSIFGGENSLDIQNIDRDSG